jgi:hypothetical protein
MKKILITFQVRDISSWPINNTIEKEWTQKGFNIEFFRKRDANQLGFTAEISNELLFDEMIKNSTFLSSSLKANGVLMETLEILELIQ